jgi:hypothetical protein
MKLTDLKWTKASSGRRLPMINQTARGGMLTINGKEYKNGISANAVSIIEYDLPEGLTRFQVLAGLDNGVPGTSQAQLSDQQSVIPNNGKFLIFTEDPAGPVPGESALITIKFDQLGLSGTHSITDLWTGKSLGRFSDVFTQDIKRHGAGLYRIH